MGEIALATGLSRQTLHTYALLGLIRPDATTLRWAPPLRRPDLPAPGPDPGPEGRPHPGRDPCSRSGHGREVPMSVEPRRADEDMTLVWQEFKRSGRRGAPQPPRRALPVPREGDRQPHRRAAPALDRRAGPALGGRVRAHARHRELRHHPRHALRVVLRDPRPRRHPRRAARPGLGAAPRPQPRRRVPHGLRRAPRALRPRPQHARARRAHGQDRPGGRGAPPREHPHDGLHAQPRRRVERRPGPGPQARRARRPRQRGPVRRDGDARPRGVALEGPHAGRAHGRRALLRRLPHDEGDREGHADLGEPGLPDPHEAARRSSRPTSRASPTARAARPRPRADRSRRRPSRVPQPSSGS